MKILCLQYAKSAMAESFFVPGGDREKKRPILMVFYLVQTQGKNILIDAGCDELPGFEFTEQISPAEAVGQAGLSPEDITDILITHAHQDHIQGVKYFPNATVHIQQDEYERGRRFIPEGMNTMTFSQTAEVADLQIIKIGGHTKGSCVVRWDKFLFVGDEYYSPENLQQKIRIGSSVAPQISQWFVEEYAQDGSVQLLFHDPGIRLGLVYPGEGQ